MQALIASEAGATKTKEDLVELGKKNWLKWKTPGQEPEPENDDYSGGDVTIEIVISLLTVFYKLISVVAQISQVPCCVS